MPTISRDGVRVFYEDEGERDDPVIVLGHSFLCAGDMWRHQLPELRRRARVLNVDYRGHGRSDRIRTRFDLADLLADVVAVLDDAGVERAVWAGLSTGGMVALRAALEHPDRVAGLALLDTDAGAELPVVRFKNRILGLGCRVLGWRPLLPAVLPVMLGRTTLAENPGLVQQCRESFENLDVPSMLRFLGALMARDSVLDRLAEIQIPALVLVGEEDRALPPSRSRRMAEALPDAELVVVPRSGHLTALEQPEAVTEALVRFLESIRAGRC